MYNTCDIYAYSEAELEHMDELKHELAVEEKYGQDTIHISNFDTRDKSKVQAVCNQLPTTFIGVSFVSNGSKIDPLLFGVYTSSYKDITRFWDIYYYRSLNKPGRI